MTRRAPHLAAALALFLLPQSDPLEAGAWLKLFGLVAETPAPVVLTEAEVNALLASEALRPRLAEDAGLSRLEAELLPDEVRLRGDLERATLVAVLGPLAPGATDPAHPVEANIRLRGASGAAEAEVLRGTVSGQALPPELLSEALLGALARAFSAESSETPPPAGSPFPLPFGLDGIEVGAGEVRLIPGAR